MPGALARVLFGIDLPPSDERRVHALTLGELVDRVVEAEPSLATLELRWFVNGRDARTLEGRDTGVGDEDVVLVTRR